METRNRPPWHSLIETIQCSPPVPRRGGQHTCQRLLAYSQALDRTPIGTLRASTVLLAFLWRRGSWVNENQQVRVKLSTWFSLSTHGLAGRPMECFISRDGTATDIVMVWKHLDPICYDGFEEQHIQKSILTNWDLQGYWAHHPPNTRAFPSPARSSRAQHGHRGRISHKHKNEFVSFFFHHV